MLLTSGGWIILPPVTNSPSPLLAAFISIIDSLFDEIFAVDGSAGGPSSFTFSIFSGFSSAMEKSKCRVLDSNYANVWFAKHAEQSARMLKCRYCQLNFCMWSICLPFFSIFGVLFTSSFLSSFLFGLHTMSVTIPSARFNKEAAYVRTPNRNIQKEKRSMK